MKILTLSNSLLEDSQGSGYIITGYVRRLRDRGHRVDVLGPQELVNLNRGMRALRYRQMLGMAIGSIIRLRQGFQIFEYYGGEAWLAIEVLRHLRGRPLLIAHSNGLEPYASQLMGNACGDHGCAWRKWYRPEFADVLARGFVGADAVVTVGEFDRAFAQREGYQAANRLLAIDNPLPDTYLGQPLVHERPPCLIFCGSWIPRKGIELLRRDVTRFLAANPEWKLILAGVGAAFRAVDHFPEALSGRLEVIPYVAREPNLMEIYRRSRIAIQASVYESFGLAAAEAMACGCALVASKVGYAAGLIDGKETLLYPSAMHPTLFDCLSRLARDEPLRRHVAANGYRRAQELRWDRAVDRLEHAYTRWIRERQGGNPEAPATA